MRRERNRFLISDLDNGSTQGNNYKSCQAELVEDGLF